MSLVARFTIVNGFNAVPRRAFMAKKWMFTRQKQSREELRVNDNKVSVNIAQMRT